MMPLPQETDPLYLSLQSKSVKFLAFLDDPYYRYFTDQINGSLLYFDHKFRVEKRHIPLIVARAGSASVLLRSTPRLKTSVWDEVAASMKQERYARHMPETKLYVETLINNGASAETRICNTGLMYFSDPLAARPLVQSVFSACMLLKQPECQIFWALHAQRYSDMIQVIDWHDPAVADILWQAPKPGTSQKSQEFGTVPRKFKATVKRMIG